jgi:hypothetical protein
MNNTSSRSHAIFSVILKQEYAVSSDTDSNANKLQPSSSDQTILNTSSTQMKKLVSKFHFVDLAGSERVRNMVFINSILSINLTSIIS